jgi:hypothetical protein
VVSHLLSSEFLRGCCVCLMSGLLFVHFIVLPEFSKIKRPKLCETHRILWSSGYHSCFIFGRSQVQMLARRPAVMTEVFHGFPQSLQADAGIAPWIKPWPLPSTPSPVHNLLSSSHSTIYSRGCWKHC